MNTSNTQKKTLQQYSNDELLMLIGVVQKSYNVEHWNDYDSLAQSLRDTFDMEVTGEDLYYHFSPHPLELDAELNWRICA